MGSETVITALIASFLILFWRITRRKTANRLDYKKGTAQSRKKSYHTVSPIVSKPTGKNEPTVPQVEVAAESKSVPDELSSFNLLMVEDLEESTKEVIFKMTEEISQPHPMLHKLTSGITDPEELVEIVKSDPEITAKILRTVNSAAFCLSRPINSINHAITYLGIAQVKDTATQFALRNSIETKTPEQEEAFSKIWAASYVASNIGLSLAQNLSNDKAAEISTLALLSYIGDLAILSARPDLAQIYLTQQSLFERVTNQQLQLQANSAIVGSMLASHWELPLKVEHGLKLSLLPMSSAPEHYPYKELDMGAILLSYIACRIGDLVAFCGIEDVTEIDFSNRSELESFYLPEHIQRASLGRLDVIMKDTAFIKKMNQFISEVGGLN
ncbi:MAG: HDOD domain-containing protein [Pseudomonadales bacterium]|nr:HDOD domain-containing protein [Pseudomonadales bacterium]